MSLAMFDLDGTLLDTAVEIAEATNRTLKDFGEPGVSDEDVRSWIGYGTGWLMRQAWSKVAGAPREEIWPKVMSRFVEHYYDTSGTSSKPYPYVLEMLGKLVDVGVKRAIVTNKETRFTARILHKHGLEKTFDMVVCGDTLPVKKPDPAMIQVVIDSLGQSVGQCLFVGDSEIDVRTAKAAGVTCWAVPYGYNMGQPIEDAQPDLVVPTVKSVPDFFKGFA